MREFEGVAVNQCYAKYQIFWENPLLSTKQTSLQRPSHPRTWERGNFPELGKPLGLGRRSREIRAKFLPPQSPRGFSALSRFIAGRLLARPTETAMLRWLIRWLHCRRHLRPKLRIARKCDGVFKKTEPQQTLNSLFSCLGSSVKDT